jgi:hypothetical protein
MSAPVLSNDTANQALKRLRSVGNFFLIMIFVAGALGGLVMVFVKPAAMATHHQQVVVIALDGTAILMGTFLAALGSGALIYAFFALHHSTRKAKADLEMLVTQGIIKIRSTQENSTTVWKAYDADAAENAPGVEVQRAGDVRSFFPRSTLETMAQDIPGENRKNKYFYH